MAEQNDQMGLFSQYGLDLNLDDLRKQDLLQRQRTSLGLVDNMGLRDPRQQAMAQMGGLLASAIGNKNWRPTEDQDRRIEVVKGTKAEFDEWAKRNPNATEWEKTTEYQRVLAKNAFKNGLPDIGSSVLTELDTKVRARKQQDLALEQLGIETRVSRETADSRIKRAKQEVLSGSVEDAYIVGSDDPNSTVSGIVQDDYSLLTGDGRRIPAGSWHRTRPMAPTQLYGKGGRGEWTIPDSESSYLRNMLQATDNQLRKTLEIDDLFLEFKDNPGQFIGDVGKVTGFADRMVRFAENFADAISPNDEGGSLRITEDGTNAGKEKYDLGSPAGRARFAKQEADFLRSVLPSNLTRNAEMANRYQSLIVEFAYATARAQEPGAKALTEGDFKRAVQAIGGSLNDPVTLRKIMFSRAMAANAELQFRFSMYDDATMAKIVSNPKAFRDYQSRVSEVNKRLSFDRGDGTPTGTSYGEQQFPGGWAIIGVEKGQ